MEDLQPPTQSHGGPTTTNISQHSHMADLQPPTHLNTVTWQTYNHHHSSTQSHGRPTTTIIAQHSHTEDLQSPTQSHGGPTTTNTSQHSHMEDLQPPTYLNSHVGGRSLYSQAGLQHAYSSLHWRDKVHGRRSGKGRLQGCR